MDKHLKTLKETYQKSIQTSFTEEEKRAVLQRIEERDVRKKHRKRFFTISLTAITLSIITIVVLSFGNFFQQETPLSQEQADSLIREEKEMSTNQDHAIMNYASQPIALEHIFSDEPAYETLFDQFSEAFQPFLKEEGKFYAEALIKYLYGMKTKNIPLIEEYTSFHQTADIREQINRNLIAYENIDIEHLQINDIKFLPDPSDIKTIRIEWVYEISETDTKYIYFIIEIIHDRQIFIHDSSGDVF